jgi:hypothetical protein
VTLLDSHDVKSYRLLRDYGNQTYDPVGVRHGLLAGAIGRYSESVPAATPGAHNDSEDAHVLEFDDESRTIGSDGQMHVAHVTRRVAFAVDAFAPENPARLFDEVAG